MSPGPWPFGGHTFGPITVQQLVGIQSLGKRGKKHREGRVGEKSREGDSLCVGWGGYKNKARI